MVGASVNGRIVTFDHKLQNGDIVEVRTSKSAPRPQPRLAPARQELLGAHEDKAVVQEGAPRGEHPARARDVRRRAAPQRPRHERRHRRGGPAADTQEALRAQPGRALRCIGYGGQTAVRSVNRVKDELARIRRPEKKTVLDKITEQAEKRTARPQKAVHGILVEGLDNCLIKFSKCCTPVPGDEIIGFITRGNGVSIHRCDCQNYQRQRQLPDNDGRWIRVGWADHITDFYTTTLHITAGSRGGFVMDIATRAQRHERQGPQPLRPRRGRPERRRRERRGARHRGAARYNEPPSGRARRNRNKEGQLMRAVVTRVKSASVTIAGETVGRIGKGFLVLLGVSTDDAEAQAVKVADRICGLRVFEDEAGKMNVNRPTPGRAPHRQPVHPLRRRQEPPARLHPRRPARDRRAAL